MKAVKTRITSGFFAVYRPKNRTLVLWMKNESFRFACG